jgi:hypothetical protein
VIGWSGYESTALVGSSAICGDEKPADNVGHCSIL